MGKSDLYRHTDDILYTRPPAQANVSLCAHTYSTNTLHSPEVTVSSD